MNIGSLVKGEAIFTSSIVKDVVAYNHDTERKLAGIVQKDGFIREK